MAVKPQLGYALQKCLRKNIHAFSDFTVKVDGVSFRCHRVILNACSEYFNALFRSQMKECQENCVDLQGVTKESFSVIFDAVYKGIDSLSKENIIGVWHATVLLQIGFMIIECERFVKKVMTAENCFAFYIHAKQLDSKRIKGFFLCFVCNNFELCRQRQNFDQLPFMDVYNILQNDYVRVDSEDSVVDVILNWINLTQKRSISIKQPDSEDDIPDTNTIEDRKQHVVKLLSAVRLCLVSNECLRKLFHENVIMSCRAACDLIFSAIDYKLSVKLRHDAWPDAAVHRATSKMKHAVVFACGQTVYVYLLKDGSTQEYATLPPESQTASLIVFDNVLYMDDVSTLRNCSQNKVWETILQNNYNNRHSIRIRTQTRRSILLSLGSYIFCCHAMNRCLQRFDCTHGCDRKWDVLIGYNNNVESLIKYKDNILLFGTGYGKEQTRLYCPDTGNITEVTPEEPISRPLDGMISFTYNDNVFVLQKNGNLWKVVDNREFLVGFKFECQLWNFTWQVYGCVVYRKQLFIFGSSDCQHAPADFQWPTSLPGIIDKVKVIQIESDTSCLPILVEVDK